MRRYSLVLALVLAFVLSACSHFTLNASMCDSIASEPNAVMPEECRNYNEEEADKAFNQTKHKQQSEEETLEYKNSQ
ncbi:MAG: lipoprotein [Sulfurimonas sp.]|nr:lipoprotein [Sulfurimonas sp.]